VTGGFPNQSVSDLMQQNLLDLIKVSGCQKVLGDCDSAFGVIAKTGSSNRPVKTK
jgi:hypothetical protein